MIRCALVAGIRKAFRCRRFDSLAVGGDCPADCPAQPDGNRIADLFVFVQQTAFDHPIVGKFLNPLYSCMDRGLFSVGCANSVAGMAGWVTTVGDGESQSSLR